MIHTFRKFSARPVLAALAALSVAMAGALSAGPAALAQNDGGKSKPGRAGAIDGELLLFEGQDLDNRLYRIDRARPSLALDFSVGSIAVHPGNKWELCDQTKYRGNCLVISENMLAIGRASIKSARPVI